MAYAAWARDSGPSLSAILSSLSKDEAAIHQHATAWSADGTKATALDNEPFTDDAAKLQAQTDALQASTNALEADLQALAADAVRLQSDASAALAVPVSPDPQLAQLLQESLQQLQQAATSIVTADPASVTAGLGVEKTANTLMTQAVAREAQLAAEVDAAASKAAAQ